MARQVVRQYIDADGVVREEVVVEPTTVVGVAPVADATVPLVETAEPVANVIPLQRAVVAQPVVGAQPVVAAAAPAATVVSRRAWHADPAAIITALAGAALLIVGLVAITRAGVDSSLDDPAVEVFGFWHTAVLGLIEAFAGALLLIAGFSRARAGAMFVAVLLAIGGAVAAIQTESFQRTLAIEEPFAWLIVTLGLIVLAVNLLVPSVSSRSTVYETHPLR